MGGPLLSTTLETWSGSAARVLDRPRFCAAPCGVRLSGEVRVVGCLGFDRGEVSEATVQAAVLAPVDPAGDACLTSARLMNGSLWKTVVLMRSVLCGPIRISTRSLRKASVTAPTRGTDAFGFAVLGEPHRGVLRPGVGVSNQLPGHRRVAFMIAGPDRHAARSGVVTSGV